MKSTLTLLFLSIAVLAYGQLLPPCPSNTTPPADLCSATCVYCDFNGMTSTTRGYTAQPPPGFCGNIENEQWLGFVANCNSMTLIATPFNCVDDNGLQLAVYQSCTTNALVCNTGMSGGANTPIVATVATVPGQQYLLCVDGFAGDQCDFIITVVPPNCASAPMLLPTLPIVGNDTMCQAIMSLSVPAVTGASHYIWDGPTGLLINGMPPPVTVAAPVGRQVSIMNAGVVQGSSQICVRPVNACESGTEVCKSVVFANQGINLGTIYVCDSASYTVGGQTYSQSGSYTITKPAVNGCDSTVFFTLRFEKDLVTQLGVVRVCPGDTFSTCGQTFSQAGPQNAVCQLANGCDSLVFFTLQNIAPAQFTLNSLVHPSSAGASNGAINVTAQGLNSTVLSYAWYNQNGQVVSNYGIAGNLPSGQYHLVVRDSFGCETTSPVYTLDHLLPTSAPDAQRCAVAVQPNPATATVRFTCQDLTATTARLVEFYAPDGRLLSSVYDYAFGQEVSVAHLPVGALYARVHVGAGRVEVVPFVRVE